MNNCTDSYIKTYGMPLTKVDEKIIDLILKHTRPNERLLEVGFGSGHFLAALSDESRCMAGVEIRMDAYKKTEKLLGKYYSSIRLIYGDVLALPEIEEVHADLLYSTGLLQCLNNDRITLFLEKLSVYTSKAIFTVPRLNRTRNTNSLQQTGVSGCCEYATGNLAYVLSRFYSYVEMGVWKKEMIDLEDDFVWFYCGGSRKHHALNA